MTFDPTVEWTSQERRVYDAGRRAGLEEAAWLLENGVEFLHVASMSRKEIADKVRAAAGTKKGS